MVDIYPLPDFTEGLETLVPAGAIVANAPLTYDALTGDLDILPAGAGSSGIITTSAQQFAGQKTFINNPCCAIAPSAGEHLANKGYIDDLVAMGIHWLANIDRTFDFTGGVDPPDLADGMRYIAISTTPAPLTYVANYIYTYDLASDSYSEYVPTEGNACYVEADDSVTFANTCILFNGTIWLNLGSSINHQSLIGAGTLTHTTIDSYLDQAVKTTSSPTFYRQNVLGSTLGSGVISPYIRWGPGGAGYTRNSASLDFTYISAGHSSNNASISLYNCNPSIKFIEEGVVISPTTISTSSTTGALVVRGGVGIGGDVYIASNKHLVFPSESSTKKIILSHDGTGSYNYRGFGTNGPYMLYNIDSSAASHMFMSGIGETMANTLVQISGNLASGGLRVFHTTASTSSTTGALTVAGGVGIGGAIFGGSSIRAATDCGLILTSDIDANTQAGSYCNLSTVYNIGVHWNRIVSGVNNAYEMTVSSTGELNIYNRSIGNYSIRINNTGLTKLSAGTFIYDEPKTDSTSSTTGVCRIDGGCGITKSVNIGARVTALNMTCSTAPTLDTDIVRKVDLTSYSPTGAIHITDTTDSTSTSTGALIVDGGIGIAKNTYIGGYLYTNGAIRSANSCGWHCLTAIPYGANIGSYVTCGLNDDYAAVILNSIDQDEVEQRWSIINDTKDLLITDITAGTCSMAFKRTGQVKCYSTFDASGIETAAFEIYGGLGVSKNVYIGGSTHIVKDTASTSTTTGALIVTGGVGIAKEAYIGGLTRITNDTDSTSISTGALVVSGGAAITKNLNTATVNNIIMKKFATFSAGWTDNNDNPEALKNFDTIRINNNVTITQTIDIVHNMATPVSYMELQNNDGNVSVASECKPSVKRRTIVHGMIDGAPEIFEIRIDTTGYMAIFRISGLSFTTGDHVTIFCQTWTYVI